jgi:imidazolonepropionase-like amidohydrolase
VAPLYADVRGLYAASGAAYTPTLLVAYGGLSGEHLYWQEEDLLSDQKLWRYLPAGSLDQMARRRGVLVRDGDWFHRSVAASAADLQRDGVPVTLGAHGQLQGLGVHWELWALGEAMGPLGALRAATADAALYLGMADHLGSIEEGKLADLLVIDGDPLTNLRDSRALVEVVRGGVRYDADTLAVIE